MEVETFIAFLEQSYRFKITNKEKLVNLVDEYSNNLEDLNKKQIIDSVFDAMFNVTLEKLIENFKNEAKIRKIETEESRLRKRVGELEETIGELRDAYWRVKQANLKN